MLQTLFLVFIAPLEFLMRLVLEWGFSWTHSWGWSLALLSLAVNTAILPLYNWAERGQEEERRLRWAMSRHEAMIRRVFRGQKRFALLTTLRRQRGLGYGLTLRATLGLLVQIPFFIAAFHLLSTWQPFQGQSFGPLADLGAPDALLALGSVTVNLLPLLMTAVNLASAFVYAADLTRRDKTQIYGMALLFLVLLYTAPSALVLYWTLNNVYSLGKNFVEKFLPGRTFRRGAAHRCHLRKRPAVAGTLAHHAARALNIMAISCAVGAVFWLAVCTAALLQRHNLLDSEFRAAMWYFAGQCALTSCAASLAQVFWFCRIRDLQLAGLRARQIFFMGSMAALFCLQLKFFQDGVALEQGHFSFDLWDGRGILSFALWMMVIFSLGIFKNKLVTIFSACHNTLLLWFNPAGTETEKSTSVPSNQKTFIVACIMGVVCGLFFWCFIPFCTYLNNPNEFDFNGWELPVQVLPYCLLTMAGVALFLFVTTYFLPYECIEFPEKQKYSYGGKVNILYTVVLTLLMLLWLEGTALSYGLPQLDGRENLFNSKVRMIIDAVILFDIFFIFVYYWRNIIKRIFFIIFLIVVICCMTLIDANRVATEKVDIKRFPPVEGLRIVNRNTLYTNLEFSRTHNIIILLVDSLDTLTFEKTLEEYPDLSGIFDGFRLFRENLGPGGYTLFAIPQILSGTNYEGIHYDQFVYESLVGRNSLAAEARIQDYKVFIDAAYWSVMSSVKNVDNESGKDHNRGNNIDDIIPLLFFRFLPYYCKHLFENNVNFGKDRGGLLADADINKQTFNQISRRLEHKIDSPIIHFFYFYGVHPPFLQKDIISTTREFINDFSCFIEELKKYDLYDVSTIVMLADHGLNDHRDFFPERKGSHSTFFFPLFMIKTKSSSGALEVRDDLMSSLYMKDVLRYLYHDSSNEAMDKYLDTLPPTRTYYDSEFGKMEASGGFSNLLLKKKATEKLHDNIIYAMSPDNIRASYAFPNAYDDQKRTLGYIELANITSSNVNMTFLYDSPMTRKQVTFQIESWKNNGSIEVIDKNSGNKALWKKKGTVSIMCAVDRNGHINIQFAPLIRQNSIIRYMIVQDEGASLPKFPPTSWTQDNADMLPKW